MIVRPQIRLQFNSIGFKLDYLSAGKKFLSYQVFCDDTSNVVFWLINNTGVNVAGSVLYCDAAKPRPCDDKYYCAR